MNITPNIIVNHVGFFTDAVKKAVFPDLGCREFELQDMGVNATQTLGDFEDWTPVYRGELTMAPAAMGDYLIGDFSSWQRPGIYRLTISGGLAISVIFAIHDGVLSTLPRLWLDYFHGDRCGNHENEWRGPCHLDDGILSRTGKQIDATGGWHDAGDTRKWMVHCILPALGLTDFKNRLAPVWNHWQEAPWQDDMLAEIAWGVRFILKVQDNETGMFYEDVGGGGDSRTTQGMKWWHENHAGCCADNAENRFTDNIRGSGDERPVRQNYNPIVQYTNITILLRTADLLEEKDADLAGKSREAARASWAFMEERLQDDFHGWTSVRSWRVLAALEVARCHIVTPGVVEAAVDELLELHDPITGFWFMDLKREDYHRGILHGAQPLIALAAYAENLPSGTHVSKCAETVRTCFQNYVEPMRQTNPFGIMPYGLYSQPLSSEDNFRPWNHGLYYRFFMPVNVPEKISHGLGAHWTSWSHALAYCGRVFKEKTGREAALDQLHWLLGNNPLHSSCVTGVGYNQPVPHSRFLGQMPGGFVIGPRGNEADEIFVDLDARCDWATCEYWVINKANSLMALSHLLPLKIAADRKLGRKVSVKS